MNRKEIIKNLRYKAENIKTHMPLQVFSEAADMLEEYELIINSLIKDCIGLDFICDKLGVSEWCEEHCNGNTPDIECVRKYYKEQNMDTNKKIELLEKEIAELKEELSKQDSEKSLATWIPKKDDNYWYIRGNGKANSATYDNDSFDKNLYVIGNYFQTKEDAEFEIERLKVIAELKRFGKDKFKKGTENCFLFYDTNNNKLCIHLGSYAITASIFFNSKEIAEQAIKTVGVDRIKKYYFRVEE